MLIDERGPNPLTTQNRGRSCVLCYGPLPSRRTLPRSSEAHLTFEGPPSYNPHDKGKAGLQEREKSSEFLAKSVTYGRNAKVVETFTCPGNYHWHLVSSSTHTHTEAEATGRSKSSKRRREKKKKKNYTVKQHQVVGRRREWCV